MSGTDRPKIIYWDACVYLAWLKAEEAAHGKDCIDAIRQIAKENFERTAVIITSTITFVEVLSASLDDDQERQFRRSFRNQDHIARDVDPPVAMKARDFRQRFLQHESGKKLATPDAIHLATASIDNGGHEKKYLGLLGLDGDERLDGLKICKPSVPQPDLFLSFQAKRAITLED